MRVSTVMMLAALAVAPIAGTPAMADEGVNRVVRNLDNALNPQDRDARRSEERWREEREHHEYGEHERREEVEREQQQRLDAQRHQIGEAQRRLDRERAYDNDRY